MKTSRLLFLLLLFSSCGKYNVIHYGCESPAVDEKFTGGFVFMPNIFTPNGDGENDRLEVFNNGVTNLSLEIKTNGGIVVYNESHLENSFNRFWDGTVPKIVDGGRYHLGIFQYKLSFTMPSGESKTVKGKVVCDPMNYYEKKDNLKLGCIQHLGQCEFGCQWDGAEYNPQLPTNEFEVACN